MGEERSLTISSISAKCSSIEGQKLELSSRTVEVVAGALDLEIKVPIQIISQKPKPELISDHLRSQGHVIDLAWLEHIAGGFEVPFDNCPENLRQKPHLIQIDLVFESRTSCGSCKIAKIVQQRSRHDGIQIDYAHSFARALVQRNVVQLGIVVNHPDGKIINLNLVGQVLATESNSIRSVTSENPIGPVVFDGRAKGLEPHPGIVKIRDRIDQGLTR